MSPHYAWAIPPSIEGNLVWFSEPAIAAEPALPQRGTQAMASLSFLDRLSETASRWAIICDAVRLDKESAELRLHNEFSSGLRALLGCQVHSTCLDATITRILRLVMRDLRSRIEPLAYYRLGKLVLFHARKLVPSETARCWENNERVDIAFLDDFSTHEQNALRFYYVDGLDEQAVVARTHMSRAAFDALRRVARERFRDSNQRSLTPVV